MTRTPNPTEAGRLARAQSSILLATAYDRTVGLPQTLPVLPILPGLVRYEEVASGEIRHALRFTAPRTRNNAVWPARHFASKLTDPNLPPLGQRFRLKAGFSLSGFSPETQVILRALQEYGMMLADNGGAWFLSGTPNEHWRNEVLQELRRVKGSDFEAVDLSDDFVAHHSARARAQR